MLKFIAANWRTILAVYIIGATVTAAITQIFLWVVYLKEDEEEEIVGNDDPSFVFSFILFSIISAAFGMLWVVFPLIIAFLLIEKAVSEKFPGIMGDLNDREER